MRSLAPDEAAAALSSEPAPKTTLRADAGRLAAPAPADEPITGAEILVRCLQEEGVRHVFGYPGGAVLYIYDAIFKQDYFQHLSLIHI